MKYSIHNKQKISTTNKKFYKENNKTFWENTAALNRQTERHDTQESERDIIIWET